MYSIVVSGALGGIRTHDHLITSEVLWPTELQGRVFTLVSGERLELSLAAS